MAANPEIRLEGIGPCPPTFGAEHATRRTPAVDPPSLVVLGGKTHSRFAERIERSSQRWPIALNLTFRTNPLPPDLLPEIHAVDILLVVVGHGDLQSLSLALTAISELDYPETVFVTEHRHDMPAACLRHVGIQSILSESEAESWLPAAIPPLADIVRARRALRAAEARRPKLAGERPAGPHDAGLFEAEQVFREVYVRTLLAQTGSRKEAAARARVPYRTFCQILSKLGVCDDDRAGS